MNIEGFIDLALKEDIGDGDHTSLASVPAGETGKANIMIKEEGIVAGVELATMVFQKADPLLMVEIFIKDGAKVKKGDIPITVSGNIHSLLKTERLVLNFMQRMSGIATKTNYLCSLVENTGAKILDTRKTTPNMRYFEKWAVRLGGGFNHRMGLYDMVMIKDNHIDFAGGVKEAIENTLNYLKSNNKTLKIEIEARDFDELKEIIEIGGVDRIMLDNFSIADMQKAVNLIDNRFETEASGGITGETIKDVANTGVNYISVGALTHHVKSMDISMVAV